MLSTEPTRKSSSGRDRDDVVRHNVRRNEADLVESINANSVIHHEGNQANGDIEVVASARDGRAHESGPENPRGKSPATRVNDHLFRYPFRLAVPKIEQLHILVQVGLIQD